MGELAAELKATLFPNTSEFYFYFLFILILKEPATSIKSLEALISGEASDLRKVKRDVEHSPRRKPPRCCGLFFLIPAAASL